MASQLLIWSVLLRRPGDLGRPGDLVSRGPRRVPVRAVGVCGNTLNSFLRGRRTPGVEEVDPWVGPLVPRPTLNRDGTKTW